MSYMYADNHHQPQSDHHRRSRRYAGVERSAYHRDFQPYDPPQSRQPSCWDPPPYRASQGCSDYDQPYRPHTRRAHAARRQPTYWDLTGQRQHQPSCWDLPGYRPRPRYPPDDQLLVRRSPRSEQPRNHARIGYTQYELQRYHPSDDGQPPLRRPSCWDQPRHRRPSEFDDMISDFIVRVEGERESLYYPNEYWDFDKYDDLDEYWDADEYDEDVDVGYVRQHYGHQRTTHSNGQPWKKEKDHPCLPRSPSYCRPTTHLCQAAACLEHPAAVQQPLPQRLPSSQKPPSHFPSATTTAPPYVADFLCFSLSHLHHDSSSSSSSATAAIPPPPATTTLPCSLDIRYDSLELIVGDSEESSKSCPSTAIDQNQVGVEEVLLVDEKNERFLNASSMSPMCMSIQEAFQKRGGKKFQVIACAISRRDPRYRINAKLGGTNFQVPMMLSSLNNQTSDHAMFIGTAVTMN